GAAPRSLLLLSHGAEGLHLRVLHGASAGEGRNCHDAGQRVRGSRGGLHPDDAVRAQGASARGRLADGEGGPVRRVAWLKTTSGSGRTWAIGAISAPARWGCWACSRRADWLAIPPRTRRSR